MVTNSNLIYDGTFDGFLSTIFHVYEYKLDKVKIQSEFRNQNQLFAETQHVETDVIKAERVWKGIKSKASRSGYIQLYYTFLSEELGVENLLLDYIRYMFNTKIYIDKNYTNPSVLKVSKLAKSVGREKHRMEAFVRFKLTKDNIYFANIEPDFNVLPLISKHFTKRYADQRWVIYDLKRKYGLYYDLCKTEIITMNLSADLKVLSKDEAVFATEEMDFQKLWKNYFKSTNIESRKNMKLHTRHVPKRYWKYLSEKQP